MKYTESKYANDDAGQSESQKDWSDYYEATKQGPPRPLLVSALKHVTNKNRAIDIGSGALNDTRYLLGQGFDVVSIDKNPTMEQEAVDKQNEKLHTFMTKFEDFNFPENEYDLASAMYSLPFIDPIHFNYVLAKIKSSLKKGGIFCGQFFGVHDEWSTNQKMTFHTKDQLKVMFEDFSIISFEEEEIDKETATGKMKHWHVFHVIARK
jgi:SAM-dependent methyltransferase